MAEPISLKILTLGNTSVGKRSIISWFSEDNFLENTTIGIEYKTKMITLNNQEFKLQIWYNSGQERYHKILPSTFLRRANGLVLIYDLTEPSSIINIESWLKQIRHKADPGIEMVLVGNKLDLVQDREFSEGQRLANQFRIPFFAVSAKSGEGVNEAFRGLVEMIISRNPGIMSSAGQNANRLNKDPSTQEKNTCFT